MFNSVLGLEMQNISMFCAIQSSIIVEYAPIYRQQ